MRPDFAPRDWNWYNFAGFDFDDVLWARRIGMNSCHEAFGPLKGPHRLVAVMESPEMKAKHPEYDALIEAWRSRLAPGNLLRLEDNRDHIWGMSRSMCSRVISRTRTGMSTPS